MKRSRLPMFGTVAAAVALVVSSVIAWDNPQVAAILTQANQLMRDANFADAAEQFRKVLEDKTAESGQVVEAMQKLAQCRGQLNLPSQLDQDVALALDNHGESFEVWNEAAQQIQTAVHYGVVADQSFTRGYSGRGGPSGAWIGVTEQDRLQSLKWRMKAIELAEKDANAQALSQMYLGLAEGLLSGRERQMAWRLQAKTDLQAEPNYIDLESQTSTPTRYAPVNEDDSPVLYALPEVWQSANSDGQRLRWALNQAAKSGAENEARTRWASFLNSQFSVDTLRSDSWFARSNDEQNDEAADGIFSIHTLDETQTIARLASGIKRFSLPEEFNPIRIYQQLARSEEVSVAEPALSNLVQIFLNRRQYPRAAELLEESTTRFGDDSSNSKQKLLANIRQPRMTFDPTRSQLAGRKASLGFVFRNATEVTFTAWPVDQEKILQETKDFYRNFNPQQNRNRTGRPSQFPVDINSPAGLFRDDLANAKRFLLDQAAQWQQALQPRDNHWDKRIQVETPLTKAGLYLVEAAANDETVKARCLVQINDTLLVRMPGENKHIFFVSDAETGRAISGANIELFGMGYSQNAGARPNFVTKSLATRTNTDGVVTIELDANFQWFAAARGENGRLALLGFDYLHSSGPGQSQYGRLKAYGVSDRPVYRPGETIKCKFWVGFAVYGDIEGPRAANSNVIVRMFDSQGTTLTERTLKTDAFGGCELDIELNDSVALGRYQFQVQLADVVQPAQARPGRDRRLQFDRNTVADTSLAIRVEEYRKPEFEVKILAPEKPVALGESIKARIEAKYYFGAPVTDATVTVKVERRTFRDSYYPIAPYDWCYGPGYWWFAPTYDWYPGWDRWVGCIAPSPDWQPRWGFEPPELVLEQELKLDSTGIAVLEIDTALAKQLYGDESHKYSISVEVRDSSRRTQTAQGSVIAAQEAFKIYTWTSRGFYNVGDRIDANFQARMLDGTPVAGTGKVDLLRIRYTDDLVPQEQIVASFDVVAGEDGRITQTLEASQAGQYRLRLRLDDGAGHTVEGASVVTVRGQNADADDFQYNALELIPEKQHYAPGETLKLQIAANRGNARVAVFVRPAQKDGYQIPKWIDMTGKSTVLEIPIQESDQPNFFVEAFTVYDGEFHQVVREIFVPPADRVFDVKVTSGKTEYLPGEEATVEIKVTDPEGKPVAGSCVIAAYDRSLEQIAPDVLPTDIREFFWKWQRTHRPQSRVNLQQIQYSIALEGMPGLPPLGVFGATLADDSEMLADSSIEELAFSPARGAVQSMMGGGFADAAPAPMSLRAEGSRSLAKSAAGEAADAAPTNASPGVRKDFADSALWLANLETNAAGVGVAKFKMPENLTSWKIRTWVVGSEIRVGSAETEAVTRKPLLVRLQQPRFLVEGDEVVISAIVHNDLAGSRTVKVALEIDGETQLDLLPGTADTANAREQTVRIESHQQARVDWRCKALAEGTVQLRAIAITEDASDAMQLDLPIVVNGILKMDSFAGTVRNGQPNSTIAISVPEQRRVEQSKLTVRLSPSLAAAMIDALPYLAEYPYGCTEQTLNRFLPTVVTQNVLKNMDIDLARLAEKRNNLNAQELGSPEERRQRWKQFDHQAVFDQQLVDDMVVSGVRRLTDMQNADGGWGWFSGAGEISGAHTTAVVVRGLLIAQQNQVAIVPEVLQRGTAWLERYQADELQKLQNADGKTKPYKEHPDNLDALVFHVLTLAERSNLAMQQLLYDQREHLSTYGKTLLAWATHKRDNVEQTQMLRRNIEQFLVEDAENETAFLRDQSPWWYWYGSEIEANALYLKLLAALEPNGRVAPRVVKYLLNNRKHATYWNSTRDTALVVEAFADYIAATGELKANMKVEVLLSGKRLGAVEFTPDNLFDLQNTIEIAGNALPAGQHELEIRRIGDGNLYWNAYSTNFTLEAEIAPAGLEVKVERRYYHLVPSTRDLTLPGKDANVIDTQKVGYDRIPLDDLQALPSGSLVEVELLVESKNDYEYLVIEDHKAASLEAVETQSGYFWSSGLSIYREFRDQHIGLCIRWLPRGKYSLRYQLRSEAPGQFTALPAVIEGMYAPELRGNSADFDLSVVE